MLRTTSCWFHLKWTRCSSEHVSLCVIDMNIGSVIWLCTPIQAIYIIRRPTNDFWSIIWRCTYKSTFITISNSYRINTTCYELRVGILSGTDVPVQLAALRRQVAPLAFTDEWAPTNGKVGATCDPAASNGNSSMYRVYQPNGYSETLQDTKWN